jgi:hypothetical protein
MKCNTKLIGIIMVISIVLLLILSGKNIGEEEDSQNTDTRGIVIMVQMSCTDNYHSILPGENTTFIINIEITHYYDTINLSLGVENVPLYWHADFNITNFTVTKNSRCNVTLLISPPENVTVGAGADITVAGSWSYRDEDSDGEEIEGKISQCMIMTKILGPNLRTSLYDSLEPNQKPKVGQKIDFIANIRNIGDVDATNISFRFLVDGKPVGVGRTIPLIEAGNYTNVSFSWVAKEGEHTIRAEADYEN